MITKLMSKFSEYVESDYNELEDSRKPIRTRIQRRGVGILEMDQYDDHIEVWCPMCKKQGFQVKLGPRVLFPNEKRPPDYDQWMQCPECAEVIAAHVVEHDATIIRDDIPTVETPFENTIEIIGANPRRTTKGGQRALAKRRKERDRPHHKDADIDREMQRHGVRVKVVYDSDP